MMQRLFNRIGRYLDEVFFGERDEKGLAWTCGTIVAAICLYLLWQFLQ